MLEDHQGIREGSRCPGKPGDFPDSSGQRYAASMYIFFDSSGQRYAAFIVYIGNHSDERL